MYTRIIQLRKSLNLTQLKFASKLKLTQGTLSGIEHNQAPLTERTILSICSIFNVNENWLRTGNRRNV